jgi:hypothetical protein
VFGWDYTLNGDEMAGTFVPGAGVPRMAGDQASMIWAQLDHRNVKGKYVFLRKYFHGGYINDLEADKIDDIYKQALVAFCNQLAGGSIVELGLWRSQKAEYPVITNDADKWVTTRTLKRRGKRPLAHA